MSVIEADTESFLHVYMYKCILHTIFKLCV